jgi:hypothetical protein
VTYGMNAGDDRVFNILVGASDGVTSHRRPEGKGDDQSDVLWASVFWNRTRHTLADSGEHSNKLRVYEVLGIF